MQWRVNDVQCTYLASKVNWWLNENLWTDMPDNNPLTRTSKLRQKSVWHTIPRTRTRNTYRLVQNEANEHTHTNGALIEISFVYCFCHHQERVRTMPTSKQILSFHSNFILFARTLAPGDNNKIAEFVPIMRKCSQILKEILTNFVAVLDAVPH